ncbi:MAG: hypothetical protein AAGA15_11510 [Pseudomonadota bacterium]
MTFYPASLASSPLEEISGHLDDAEEICDLLEAVADRLPQSVAFACREVSSACMHDLPRLYDEIRFALMPIMRARVKEGDAVNTAIIDRLEADMIHDSARFCELMELLDCYSMKSNKRLAPDAFGYALRGYFESMRRILLWQREILLPLAEDLLEESDLERLEEALNHVPRRFPQPEPFERPALVN